MPPKTSKKGSSFPTLVNENQRNLWLWQFKSLLAQQSKFKKIQDKKNNQSTNQRMIKKFKDSIEKKANKLKELNHENTQFIHNTYVKLNSVLDEIQSDLDYFKPTKGRPSYPRNISFELLKFFVVEVKKLDDVSWLTCMLDEHLQYKDYFPAINIPLNSSKIKQTDDCIKIKKTTIQTLMRSLIKNDTNFTDKTAQTIIKKKERELKEYIRKQGLLAPYNPSLFIVYSESKVD